MYELAIVLEELAAAGCGLLMMVVSPAICGTIIARFGTDGAEAALAAGLADGTVDHGLRHHRAGRRLQLAQDHHDRPPRRRRLGPHRPQDLHLRRRRGRRGADRRRAPRTPRPASCEPALFVVPTDTPGFSYRPLEMDIVMPEKQFLLFLDDVRLPADALIGDEDAALLQLFAGLNPERIMASALAVGIGPVRAGQGRRATPRSAPSGACRSARTRAWRTRWPRRRSSWNWPG